MRSVFDFILFEFILLSLLCYLLAFTFCLDVDKSAVSNIMHENHLTIISSRCRHVIPGEYHAPSYMFTPANINELATDNQSLFGQKD